MVGSCRPPVAAAAAAAAVSSSVEQFHRLVRNWNLHSSMARLAPVWTLNMKPGCFLQNWTCFVSSVSASWSQIDGVPIAADATELALDRALRKGKINKQKTNRFYIVKDNTNRIWTTFCPFTVTILYLGERESVNKVDGRRTDAFSPPLTGPKKEEEEEEYFHNKTDRQDGGIIRASDTQETAGGPALQGEKNLFRGRKMVLLLPSETTMHKSSIKIVFFFFFFFFSIWLFIIPIHSRGYRSHGRPSCCPSSLQGKYNSAGYKEFSFLLTSRLALFCSLSKAESVTFSYGRFRRTGVPQPCAGQHKRKRGYRVLLPQSLHDSVVCCAIAKRLRRWIKTDCYSLSNFRLGLVCLIWFISPVT